MSKKQETEAVNTEPTIVMKRTSGGRGEARGPRTTHVVYTEGGFKNGNRGLPDGGSYEAVQYMRRKGVDIEATMADAFRQKAKEVAEMLGEEVDF